MYDAAGKLEAGVTELMCHPAANSQLMESTFHWGYHGEDELKALLSAPTKERAQRKGCGVNFIQGSAIHLIISEVPFIC